MRRRPTDAGLGIGVTLSLSVPFLLIDVAHRAMSPLTLAGARFLLATATLAAIAAVRRRLGQTWNAIVHLACKQPLAVLVAGLCAGAIPTVMLAIGEQHVPTGATSVLVATTPVWIVLGNRLCRKGERIMRWQSAALLAAILGSALVAGAGVPTTGLSWSVLPAASAMSYATASLIVRHRFQSIDPLVVTLAEMLTSAVVMVPLATAGRGWPRWEPTAWAAVIALGIACSGLGWLANTALVLRVGPNRASMVSYTSIVVAVLLGTIVLDERFSAREAFGVAVVLASVAAFLRAPTRSAWTAARGATGTSRRKEPFMLELCILGFLAEEPLHAYELRRRITGLTGHVQPVSDGALHPALRRLQNKGFLTARDEPGEAGPPRRVFALTVAGRDELRGRLSQPSDVDVSDRNRYFVVLAFLDLLPSGRQRRAVLQRRLDFLERPGRAFFVAGDHPLAERDVTSPYRKGMYQIARATSKAERAWLTGMLSQSSSA